MGLIWFLGLAVGWVAMGFLGVPKLVCNAVTGGDFNRVIGKYSAKAAYKTDSPRRDFNG